MKRLNGWQRIGLVLSILWGLFVIGTVSYEYFQFFQSELREKECLEKYQKTNDKNVPEWLIPKECLEEKTNKPMFLAVLSALFLPVFGGWLFVYVVVWTTRWVATGFQSKNKGI